MTFQTPRYGSTRTRLQKEICHGTAVVGESLVAGTVDHAPHLAKLLWLWAALTSGRQPSR